MRFSCPIFCSDIDVFKEICEQNAIFFNPKDEEDLVYKLENSILDSFKIKKFLYKKLYNIKKLYMGQTCRETLNIYKKLI